MDFFSAQPVGPHSSAHTAGMKNPIRTLLSAFKSASLIDGLRSPGQYEICAPTDAAFKRMPAGSLEVLFKNARTLRPVLFKHTMPGTLAANDALLPAIA